MSFRKSLTWSVGGQIASHVIFFVVSVLVARLLSPAEMGIFAVAVAMIGVMNTFVAFDLGTYVIRSAKLEPQTLNSVFTINAITSFGMAGAIALLSYIQRYLGHMNIAEILFPMALTPLIGAFEFRPSMMLQREMNFRLLTAIKLARMFLGGAITVGMAANGFGVMSLVYGSVAGSLIGAIASNVFGYRHVGFRASLAEARQIVPFGLRMLTIGAMSTIASRVSDLVLGGVQGVAALGLYSRASGISSLLFENVYGAVTRVVFVKLSADHRDQGSIHATFIRSYEMILIVMWPMQLGIAVLSGPTIFLLYGEQWLPAAAPLSLLMVSQFIILCFGMNWELFVLHDEVRLQTRIELIRAATGVVVFSVGCFYGLTAAAFGRVVEALFGLLLYVPHMGRLAGVRNVEFARIWGRSLLLTLSAVCPSLALMLATDWSAHTAVPLVSGAVLLGVCFWFLLLYRLKHPLFLELNRILERTRRRA